MKKQVMFVILEQFADYEYPFLAAALNGNVQDKDSPYEVKTLSLGKNPVRSIGGFTVLPDYSVDDCPADYAAIILIGGNTWRTEEARTVAPLLHRATDEDKVVAAICDATVFLGMNGLLNGRLHTSNSLESLLEGASDSYTGQQLYKAEQAVRDDKLVTANGTAHMEFAREVLAALDAYPAEYIDSFYDYYKLGYMEMIKAGSHRR